MTGRNMAWAILLCLLLYPIFALASDSAGKQTGSSKQDPFQLRTSVISSAGAPTANSTFQLNGSLGQPAPTGITSDDGFTHFAGFWSSYQRSWLSGVPSPELLRNRLFQNFPNPFNPLTTIQYSVANENRVKIVIYNIRGERVRELVNEVRLPGRYKAIWDGKNGGGRTVASGVYFYQLRIGQFHSVKKMLLLK